MSNTYQKDRRRAQPDPLPGEVAVPEQVIVSMAEIAAAAREGLLALAVSTGLQVMTAMFDEDVTRLCGPDGRAPGSPAALTWKTSRRKSNFELHDCLLEEGLLAGVPTWLPSP